MSLRILQVFEPFINNPHSIKTHVAAANLTLVLINLLKHIINENPCFFL